MVIDHWTVPLSVLQHFSFEMKCPGRLVNVAVHIRATHFRQSVAGYRETKLVVLTYRLRLLLQPTFLENLVRGRTHYDWCCHLLYIEVFVVFV